VIDNFILRIFPFNGALLELRQLSISCRRYRLRRQALGHAPYHDPDDHSDDSFNLLSPFEIFLAEGIFARSSGDFGTRKVLSQSLGS
jgi:hypothetical protein